ncbi:MAG: 16S rRNA (cytosine(1402)-N(4))-methyltransferase RsmH [Spirosomataceae bacterium]
MSSAVYHIPILLKECLEGLSINPDGTYVDVTFGGGGHSKVILEQLGENGRLFAFDQDADAKAQAKSIDDKRFVFIEANFRHIQKYLRVYRVSQVDGILADLGISSHQIDDPSRGFSTRFDGELDMRMNQQATFTAKQLVNEYSIEQLHRIFGMYGEVTNARTLASALFAARTNKPIHTTQELKAVLQKFAPRGKENKYFAQVFQAIRIEVNDELKALEEFLTQVPDLLSPEGRLAVITFHSLEDRLVKNYIQKGKFYGEVEKDIFGNELRPLQSVTRKPIEASPAEIAHNSRARSAKLRVATLYHL